MEGIKVISCPCRTQDELERKMKQVFHAATRSTGAFVFFTSLAVTQMLQMAMHRVTLTAETEAACVCVCAHTCWKLHKIWTSNCLVPRAQA